MANIIFDITDTLKIIDRNKRKKQFLKMLQLTNKTKPINIESFMHAYMRHYKKLNNGIILNDNEFLSKLFLYFKIKLSKKELKKIQKFHINCRRKFVSLAPFGKKILILLKKKKHKISILSNEVERFAELDWKSLRINSKKMFKIKSYASYKNSMKPNKLAFIKIAKKLKCKPSQSFMIGNSYLHDIIPAKEIGMKTIFLNLKRRKNNKKADFIIKSLNEIPKIVD
ncbi:MAG: HAD family hydrolase [archaeon]|nr:HAD family hydrolase [archaeon]